MLHTTATNFTTSNTMLFHLLCSSSFGTIHINTTLMMHKEFVILVESCGIINIILAFPTTFCNLSVIVVLCKSKHLLTVSNIPLLSLAVTDLLTGTISMPVYGSYLILIADKDLLCSLNLTCYFMGIILVMVSLLTVFLLALERYLAIVHTFFYRKHINKAIVVCLVIFIWLFVISFTLGTILSGKSAILTNTSIAVIVLAYGWSAFVYCNIFLVVKRLRKHDVRPSLALPSSNMAKSSSRSYKTNRLSKFSGIVIAVLLFFYLPFVIAKVMSGYVNTDANGFHLVHFYIDTWMLLNSFANPVMYCWQSPAIGREVKKLSTWNIHTNQDRGVSSHFISSRTRSSLRGTTDSVENITG